MEFQSKSLGKINNKNVISIMGNTVFISLMILKIIKSLIGSHMRKWT